MYDPTEVYEKMDYEGGFWELVSHSGTEFLKGSPYESKIAQIEEVEKLVREITDYFASISVPYEEEDYDYDAYYGDEEDEEEVE